MSPRSGVRDAYEIELRPGQSFRLVGDSEKPVNYLPLPWGSDPDGTPVVLIMCPEPIEIVPAEAQ